MVLCIAAVKGHREARPAMVKKEETIFCILSAMLLLRAKVSKLDRKTTNKGFFYLE